MVCDSTNVFNPEASGSGGRGLSRPAGGSGQAQRQAGAGDDLRLATSHGCKRLGAVAQETGRRLCMAGRSLDRIIEVAQGQRLSARFPGDGGFQYRHGPAARRSDDYRHRRAGRTARGAGRIAESSHQIDLSAGDVVLFSSRVIPGNEMAIGRVQNMLALRGVVMVSDRQADIHVSGHPGRPELEALYGWLRPRYPGPGAWRNSPYAGTGAGRRVLPGSSTMWSRRTAISCASPPASRASWPRCAMAGWCSMAISSCPPMAMPITMRRRISRDGMLLRGAGRAGRSADRRDRPAAGRGLSMNSWLRRRPMWWRHWASCGRVAAPQSRSDHGSRAARGAQAPRSAGAARSRKRAW